MSFQVPDQDIVWDLSRLETDPPSRRPTRPPSPKPTQRPTRRTKQPTREPTRRPTDRPTRRPTPGPTTNPTRRPTDRPTRRPTPGPTPEPTPGPTPVPTPEPTPNPTPPPSPGPTTNPSPPPSAGAPVEPVTPAPVATTAPTEPATPAPATPAPAPPSGSGSRDDGRSGSRDDSADSNLEQEGGQGGDANPAVRTYFSCPPPPPETIPTRDEDGGDVLLEIPPPVSTVAIDYDFQVQLLEDEDEDDFYDYLLPKIEGRLGKALARYLRSRTEDGNDESRCEGYYVEDFRRKLLHAGRGRVLAVEEETQTRTKIIGISSSKDLRVDEDRDCYPENDDCYVVYGEYQATYVGFNEAGVTSSVSRAVKEEMVEGGSNDDAYELLFLGSEVELSQTTTIPAARNFIDTLSEAVPDNNGFRLSDYGKGFMAALGSAFLVLCYIVFVKTDAKDRVKKGIDERKEKKKEKKRALGERGGRDSRERAPDNGEGEDERSYCYDLEDVAADGGSDGEGGAGVEVQARRRVGGGPRVADGARAAGNVILNAPAGGGPGVADGSYAAFAAGGSGGPDEGGEAGWEVQSHRRAGGGPGVADGASAAFAAGNVILNVPSRDSGRTPRISNRATDWNYADTRGPDSLLGAGARYDDEYAEDESWAPTVILGPKPVSPADAGCSVRSPTPDTSGGMLSSAQPTSSGGSVRSSGSGGSLGMIPFADLLFSRSRSDSSGGSLRPVVLVDRTPSPMTPSPVVPASSDGGARSSGSVGSDNSPGMIPFADLLFSRSRSDSSGGGRSLRHAAPGDHAPSPVPPASRGGPRDADAGPASAIGAATRQLPSILEADLPPPTNDTPHMTHRPARYNQPDPPRMYEEGEV